MQDSRMVLILNLGSTDQKLLRSRSHIIRETTDMQTTYIQQNPNGRSQLKKWRNHTSLLSTLKRYTCADNFLISKEAHVYIIKLIKQLSLQRLQVQDLHGPRSATAYFSSFQIKNKWLKQLPLHCQNEKGKGRFLNIFLIYSNMYSFYSKSSVVNLFSFIYLRLLCSPSDEHLASVT